MTSKYKVVSVSSEWLVADRFAEYLQHRGIPAKVCRADAFQVSIPATDHAQADKLASGFDPAAVFEEIIAGENPN